MATWLRQSTVVDIAMGPFLDSTDGNTVEGALTITQPDIRLKKNGGAWAQKNAAQTLTHEENGWYEVALNATDTDTLGILVVAIHEAGALPVWREFLVVPAQVWDSFLAADLLQVDVTQVGGTAQTAGDVIGDTNDIQTRLPAALVGGRIDASVGAMAAGVVTAAAIAADAITDAKVAADVTIASVTGSVGSVVADVGITQGGADKVWLSTVRTLTTLGVSLALDVWNVLEASVITAATMGLKVKNNLDALVSSRAAAADYTAGRAANLDNLNATVSSRAVPGDAMALTVAERASVADKILGRSIAGGADGGRSVAQALAFLRNKWSISGTTLTVFAADDATPLFTAEITSAAGNPITSVDPA